MPTGAGIPRFDGAHPPQQFSVTGARTIDVGVTFATYRRLG